MSIGVNKGFFFGVFLFIKKYDVSSVFRAVNELSVPPPPYIYPISTPSNKKTGIEKSPSPCCVMSLTQYRLRSVLAATARR